MRRGKTDGQTAFLATVRARLYDGIPANPLRPLLPVPEPIPPLSYTVAIADLSARFCEALTSVAGRAVRPDGTDGVIAALLGICEEKGVSRVVVSRDPECDGVVDALRAAGVDARPLDSFEDAAGADLGITGAICGIALTGTIVVDSARAGGRAASLLPPTHVALLPASRLVATPGEFFAQVSAGGGTLPSNLALITGPSRSSDIEMQLTLGVHGPQAVVVILLGDEPDGT